MTIIKAMEKFNCVTKKLFTLFFYSLFCISLGLLTAETFSQSVQDLVIKYLSFENNTPEKNALSFYTGISTLSTDAEKLQALKLLSTYEEANYLYAYAAEHYSKAAILEKDVDEKKAFQLKAARSYIMAGDSQLGSYILNNIILEAKTKGLKQKAEIYLLFSDLSNPEKKTISVKKIKQFLADPDFYEYKATLNFALYWLTGDENIKNTLLKNFPKSIETAIIKNEATISPVAFWYLMPRNETKTTKKPKTTNAKTSTSEDNSKPFAYQLGFFKNKSYAENLVKELKLIGFAAYVKVESKTSSYSVLVDETSETTSISESLRNAGYECYPVFK